MIYLVPVLVYMQKEKDSPTYLALSSNYVRHIKRCSYFLSSDQTVSILREVLT